MGHNHAAGINMKLQLSIQPNIGLDGDTRQSIMEILNPILANEALLAMKTRSARWHLSGPGFLDLRALFDQQFHQLIKFSDEIAERMHILGGFAISSFVEFLQYSQLEEHPGEAPDMMGLLADHEALVRFLREDARKCLEEYEDHGTYVMLVRLISSHERMAWVLRSYIEPEPSLNENKGNKPPQALH